MLDFGGRAVASAPADSETDFESPDDSSLPSDRFLKCFKNPAMPVITQWMKRYQAYHLQRWFVFLSCASQFHQHQFFWLSLILKGNLGGFFSYIFESKNRQYQGLHLQLMLCWNASFLAPQELRMTSWNELFSKILEICLAKWMDPNCWGTGCFNARSRLGVGFGSNWYKWLSTTSLFQKFYVKLGFFPIKEDFMRTFRHTHTHTNTNTRHCPHTVEYVHTHAYIYIYLKHMHTHTHLEWWPPRTPEAETFEQVWAEQRKQRLLPLTQAHLL